MPDNYVINIISNADKIAYKQVAQVAIGCLKKKITELQQMVADNVAMPTMNQPHQVAFYIKDAIGIPNRASQSGLTSGATNESYYIRFIPINKQDIVIDLRTTDHLRGEEWSDRKDKGEHSNLRASAIVQDTSGTTPTVVTKKPHIANGIKIKRVVQNIPTMLYGTPEQVIKHLKTLVCLFQNGYFGKYKEKEVVPSTTRNNQNINCNRNMNKKLIRLTENDLHKIVKRSVNKILREGIDDITPLSTHIHNNQDTDLETLGNIVDELRKVKEGGALSKWNPTIAARLRKSGLVDTETVKRLLK